MTTLPGRLIVSSTALAVLIGCGSFEIPEAEVESVATEEMSVSEERTPEPQPFRIEGNQIVADTFDLAYDLRDGLLTIALETDLGDAANLIASVSRAYWELGSDEEYPVDYFSESSSVGAWRAPRTVTLDHDAWRREIVNRQRRFAAGGEPFTVSRIAEDLKISFVLPVNQDPPFERLNANLTGEVVTQSGNRRIVRRELSVPYPIDATNVGQSQFANPLILVSQTTYRTSGETPIVPEIDPADPLAVIEDIQRLSPGDEFTVLETTNRSDTPWYRVQTHLGEGWINSTALLGQEILAVR